MAWSNAPRRRSVGLRGALVVAVAALVTLAGCDLKGSGYRYVRNADTQTYFKVPEAWGVREPGRRGRDREDTDQLRWHVTFNGAAPSDDETGDGLDPRAQEPTGIAQVVALSAEERESINFSVLNNVLFPLTDAINDGSAEVLAANEVDHLEGFRGRRIVFTVDLGDRMSTVDQTTLLDDATRTLYVFVIGCDADCYDRNKSVIDSVVESWTVKER